MPERRPIDLDHTRAPGTRHHRRSGWVANALFAVTAIPVALGRRRPARGGDRRVALLLFLVAGGSVRLRVRRRRWPAAARGDNVAVANLFFLQGSAPKPIRRKFLWMFLVCLAITVGTAAWEPFGVLVPMLPVGLAGHVGAPATACSRRDRTARAASARVIDSGSIDGRRAHEQIDVDAPPRALLRGRDRVRDVPRVGEAT